MDTIKSSFSHLYRAWTIEDEETMVTVSDVPHRLCDEDLRKRLSKFGTLSTSCTIMHKDDLGFFNFSRSFVVIALRALNKPIVS